MSARLDRVQNWLVFAEEVKYCVTALARKSGTSMRVLERHFVKNFGKSPKRWLEEQRQKRAWELLNEGRSIKETADLLGFKYAHHFSRQFKAYWGFCPSTLATSNELKAGKCRILV
jgi:transcriptional regulator GlxA family with amidase domain